MKATLHSVYLLLATMLAPTLFAVIEICGVKPNLFLIYLVFSGFYVEQKEAIRLGLVFGLVYDIIVGSTLGVNTILFMFVCFLTVLFCENLIRRSNALLSVLCVAVWTVIVEAINFAFSDVTGFWNGALVIGIEVLYNGIVMLLIYIPLSNLFKRLYEEKR